MSSERPSDLTDFCYPEFLKQIMNSLTNEDYEFSIDFDGLAWDVYKFDVKISVPFIPGNSEQQLSGQIVFRIGQAMDGSEAPFLYIRSIVGGRRSEKDLIALLQAMTLAVAEPKKGKLLQ